MNYGEKSHKPSSEGDKVVRLAWEKPGQGPPSLCFDSLIMIVVTVPTTQLCLWGMKAAVGWAGQKQMGVAVCRLHFVYRH